MKEDIQDSNLVQSPLNPVWIALFYDEAITAQTYIYLSRSAVWDLHPLPEDYESSAPLLKLPADR